MRIHHLLILLGALFIGAGCSGGDDDDDATADDDDVSDDDDDDDDDDDTTGDDDDDDTGLPGDISTSCADAPALPMDGEWTQSELEAPEDEDFFTFTLAEDAFVDVWTGFYDEAVEGQLDPVLSLYTEDGGTLLATADDQIPRANTDSQLRYHAFAGTYCVKIEGWEHWAGTTASIATTDWTYALNALVMDPSIPDTYYEGVLNPDTEPNDIPGQAQAGTLYEGSSALYATVFGLMDSADDVDIYAFTTGANGAHMSVYFYKPTGPGSNGSEGHGTTLELGTIDISDTMGNIIAQVDGTRDMEQISLPFDGPMDILLWVRPAAGWSPGENDFYVIDVTNAFQSNPLEGENEDDSNNSPVTAESTSFADGSAYLAGSIYQPNDVDFWEFSATAGQTFAVACGAARNGSGLVDAHFAVWAADGTVLQEETETLDADVLWSDSAYVEASMPALEIADAGDYYLVVTTGSQSADVTSSTYMCGIHDQG